MKKSEADALGYLIVIGIVVYPFVWLYEKIGWIGIIALGFAVLGAIVLMKFRNSQREYEEFNRLVLYSLHNRATPQEARKLNSLYKDNYPRAMLIRRLQILRDSIEISLSSKKRETAESRMDEVLSSYAEIKSKYADLITSETMSEIARVVEEHERKFSTSLYTNIANAHLEKAGKLKTIKSKSKYAELAMEAILEGLKNPKSDKSFLEKMQAEIERYTQSLETTS